MKTIMRIWSVGVILAAIILFVGTIKLAITARLSLFETVYMLVCTGGLVYFVLKWVLNLFKDFEK